MSKEKKNILNVFGVRRHDGSNPTVHESQPLIKTIKSFFCIAVPYWKSRDSLFSWVLLSFIAFFTVMPIYLAKQFNDWYKEFWDNVQGYYLDRYLINGAFYSVQLTDQQTDNPDQRIAEDLDKFVSLTISIIISIVTDLAMLVTFSIILWGLSHSVEMPIFGHSITLPDGYLFYLALIYALLGTIITFVMGKPLVLLNFRQQRYEADFRFSLIRLRENAESVAIYKGKKKKKRRFGSLFMDVVRNYKNLISKVKSLGFFTLGYAQAAVIFPYLIAAPMYFAKILTIGDLMQISSAFGRVQDSLSTLISNFKSLAEWKAVIDRLSLFENSLKKTTLLPKPNIVEKSIDVVLNNLTVSKPDKTVLIEHINLSLSKGDRLLIQGHSGCGKSTLLRTIAGIWPFAQGEIILPKDKLPLFLSQKPYMPLGTLRDAIFYPRKPECSDQEICKLLEDVGLKHLTQKLDVIDQWSHMLSLGEQQRIAFLRALLIKPSLVFLDEVTSALDEDNENMLYKMLIEKLPDCIVIRIGHRNTLKAYHNRYFAIDKGSYRLS